MQPRDGHGWPRMRSVSKVVRLLGLENTCNEVVVVQGAERGERTTSVLVFFGGDLQTWASSMASQVLSNSRSSLIAKDFNIEATAQSLFKSLNPNVPVTHTVMAVHPSQMIDGFSHFDNFVKSKDGQGSPSYDKAGSKTALRHLKALLRSAHIDTQCHINVMAFSKGVGVLNQLIFDLLSLDCNNEDEELKLFGDRFDQLIFVDGGHNGTEEVYITDCNALDVLAKSKIRVELRMTSYQLHDRLRPWIREQQDRFVKELLKRDVDVRRGVFFQEENKRLKRSDQLLNHFRVLHTFRDLPQLPREHSVHTWSVKMQLRMESRLFFYVLVSSLAISEAHGSTSDDIDDDTFSLNVDDEHGHSHSHDEFKHDNASMLTRWLAALASITLVSLCGVFGVLVIPLMQKMFYQHLIQFLVALAVGTLSGDALLHLLPHALTPHVGNEELHEEMHLESVWKGLFALLSLFVFLILEKLVNVFGECRRSVEQQDETKVKVVRSGHRASDLSTGRLECKHKYSNYCATDDVIRNSEENGENEPLKESPSAHDAVHDSQQQQQCVTTVFIREHEQLHHGHSHAHTHLHSKPESISSVAWMVILGDGIHNMADGMAIGAAFADSIVSGISTSIAVLCHELPHEIGDFAMLLKAGMNVKQAVFYNLLSSFLSLVGMMLGLFLGNMTSITPLIFCATAGIFLYVALVDMVPELNSGHTHPISNETQKESHFVELTMQLLGISSGAGVMLLIALYEHDLKRSFHF